MEIWKDIPNYEGQYQASSYGRIRSTPGRVTFTKMHGERRWESRIIKPKKCSDYNLCGYRVTLWKCNKPKDFLVARLVCTTFHENLIDTKMTVNHINGNRLDNRPENLEWLTLSDNIKAGFKTGLYKKLQKKQTIRRISDNKIFEFDSRSECSRWLGRNCGYITLAIERNRKKVRDKNGNEYELINGDKDEVQAASKRENYQ